MGTPDMCTQCTGAMREAGWTIGGEMVATSEFGVFDLIADRAFWQYQHGDRLAALTLCAHGIAVAERVPLTPHPNDHNLAYLLAKRDRMGHVLPDLAGHDVAGLAGAPAAPVLTHEEPSDPNGGPR